MPATYRIIIAVIICTAVGLHCSSYSGKSFVPDIQGYQEKTKKVYVLGKDLLEISGLVHLEGNRIAAINDEEGMLFFHDLEKDSSETYKFGGKGDYEEIVKTDSGFFVLDSKGDLYHTRTPGQESEKYKFPGKNIEFESLVWYDKENQLVLISKDQRKKRTDISAYSFDLRTKQFNKEPLFNISYKQIFLLLENYNADCKPSAAAISPINDKLYILASIGKVLLECTRQGKLTKIYKINPTQFPQPEGITFAANGDMYISNEGLEGKATILKFPYSGRK
jgi:hypothetical protein